MAKNLSDFEKAHGTPKIKSLERRLAAEREKVAALSGIQHRVAVERRKSCNLRFALIGDLHIGSLYAHEGALEGFFRHLESEGIKDCYVTGDVLDGHRIYKGQEFEVRDVGLDAQLARLESLDLSDKVNVSFITGNHDASFKHLCGVSVGKAISDIRPGWKFLGEDQARVKFETPSGPYEIMLLHPGGGSAYAVSYKPQKIAEQLEGGNKPNMLCIGHFHKAEMVPMYRNICLVQTGTFCRQTPFMARQGLAAHVGGWVFEVFVGEDHNSIRGEFVAVYI